MRMREVSIVVLVLAFTAACMGSSDHSQRKGNDAISLSRDSQARMIEVPSGTLVQVLLDQELDPHKNKPGDSFTGEVVAPVEADGRTAIPAKARVHGRVTAVEKADDPEGTTVLRLDFTSLEIADSSYPLEATMTRAHPKIQSHTSAGDAAAKVGVGAAGGAILGRILGGDAKSSALGAIAGAAAGTAIVLGTRDTYAVLPAGSVIELRTDAALRLDAES